MATLTSTITESVVIEGDKQGGTTSLSITGINDTFTAFVEVPQATEITLYSASAARTGITGFNWTDIKYSRITNLHATHNVDLIIQNSDDHEIVIKLGPGQSYVFWDHAADIFEATGSAITLASGAVATANLTIADGDEAASGQFTEGEYVKFIATDGTVGIFILSDSSETGAVASGTVLSSGSDLGTGTPSASLLAQGVCVAVTMNLNTCTQALLLNELRDTMGASTSPLLNKISGAAGTVPSSDGNQSLLFSQAIPGAAGNSVTTTDISQLTAPDFTSGVDYGAANAEDIKSINAIPETGVVRLEVFVATA